MYKFMIRVMLLLILTSRGRCRDVNVYFLQ